MKVIFLGDSIGTQRTGIHYYGLQLVRRMVQALPSCQFSIVLPQQRGDVNIEQIIVPIRKEIPFHLRLRQLITIPRLIRKIEPDLVIELAHFGPFFLPRNITRITVIHDLTPISHPEYHGMLSILMHNWLLPSILRATDQIIVNSKQTKRDLVNRMQLTAEQIHVVYPQISSPRAIDRNRATFRIPQQPYFLVVGTLEPRKNHLCILQAFEHIAVHYPDYKLVFAGQHGWKSEEFHTKLAKTSCKDQVLVTGYLSRTSLWNLYEHAFAFVQASHYEGFGLPVLEAMQFSLPLVLSDRPTLPEIAEDAALYFDPNDYIALAQHMRDICDNADLLMELRRKSQHRCEAWTSMSQADFDFITKG